MLSNEEVTADGRSERGNFPVFRKPLTQWMLRITAYADRLLADLDQLDWPEKVRTMQRNWIGRSTGAHIAFAEPRPGALEVFTTRPDTLFGATYMVIAPEHPLVDALTAGAVAGRHERALDRRRRDAGRGGRRLPGRGRAPLRPGPAGRRPREDRRVHRQLRHQPGQRRADPGLRRRLRADGLRHRRDHGRPRPGRARLGVRRGLRAADRAHRRSRPRAGTARRTPATARRSTPPTTGFVWTGWTSPTAKATIIEWLEANGHGRGAVTYKLRDWLFSRQRYWGEPFPIVYDETGLPLAVPGLDAAGRAARDRRLLAEDLPPDDADSTPEPPLGRLTDWVEVELDLGDGPKKYRRETNTMPNWAGSCWYELRYLDPTNTERLVDPEVERYWMGPSADRPLGGVDLYVGGVEHAVLHLLYARFWHKVLFDLGYLSSSEPFHRLVNQGYDPGLRLHATPTASTCRRPRWSRTTGDVLLRRAAGSTASTGRWARR